MRIGRLQRIQQRARNDKSRSSYSTADRNRHYQNEESRSNCAHLSRRDNGQRPFRYSPDDVLQPEQYSSLTAALA